jgi:tRNA (cmo5U34)-methyltransferase
MNEFDVKAAGWDQNPMHWDRSKAVVYHLLESIPLNEKMNALEYGAGTGTTSLLLKDHLKKIIMMDSSAEMVRIMNENIKASGADNLKALFFDLERDKWNGRRFDLILTQMVLHHVIDIENIIKKFFLMMNPGGYLAIADLYPEDGSFHGDGFTGHKGFDMKKLSSILEKHGFTYISGRKCFEIKKIISDGETKQFDVFLLTAKRVKIKATESLAL